MGRRPVEENRLQRTIRLPSGDHAHSLNSGPVTSARALLVAAFQSVAGTDPEPVTVAEAAGGLVVFVEDAGAIVDGASDWPPTKLTALVRFYDEAIVRYTAELAFGSSSRWADAFGISPETPIRVVYAGNGHDVAPARAGWVAGIPVISHTTLRTSVSTAGVQLELHELAHIWDGAHDWALGEAIADTVQNPEGFATAKARDEGSKEDFAESVTATLWPGYAINRDWSDDVQSDRRSAPLGPDGQWTMDRHDYVTSLFLEAAAPERP